MTQNLKIFPKIIKTLKIKIKSHAYYWLVWDFNNCGNSYNCFGSKRFSYHVKKVGSWIGTTKKYINNIQNEVSIIDIEDNSIQKEEFKEKDKKEEKQDA